MNESKTKYLTVNLPEEYLTKNLTGASEEPIENVNDFIYLGFWIASSERDFLIRKGKAWAACQ